MAGFYGCCSVAEPIYVQLNLATYFIEVLNTLSEQLSNVAIEASVWDLEGTCLHHEVFDNLSIPSKKIVAIVKMKYLMSKNPKLVSFFCSSSIRCQIMGLYLGISTGCICLVEITSYWSHTGRRKFPSRLHQGLLLKCLLMKWKCR